VSRRKPPASPSPSTHAGQLADPADDQVAFEAAQPVEEQPAVKVIDFMLQRSGEQALALDLDRPPESIRPAYTRPRGAGYGCGESWQTQATFILELQAIA
jgi:hypothetical protein